MSKRNDSEEELKSAVSAVKRTKVNISKIASDFGIPRKTLSDHVNGKYNRTEHGPSRMLSDSDENALVSYMKYLSRQGFPLTRAMVRTYVVALVKRSDNPSLFNLNKWPSDMWFRKFFSRHTELTEKKSEQQDRGRARMSNTSVMDQYFTLLSGEIVRLELKGKPAQIYNCDETGWSGKEKSNIKVIGLKGTHTYQQTVTSAGHVTAHLCIAADGRVLPTFLIFEKCLPHTTYKDGVPGNWLFGYSESGYMDSDLFHTWFKELFIPNCGKDRPVMLVMDNHDSHISLEVVRLAMQNNITLLGLPPHTTHILQPLDVSINGPLKAKVQSLAMSLGFINKQQVLNKAKFPVFLSYAIDQQLSPACVKNSFRKSGLYPVDKDAIDQSQIAPSHITNQSAEPSTSATAAVSMPTSACPTCGTFLGGNPLVKEGLIPEHLAELFPAVPLKTQSAPRRKVITKARVITSVEFYQQLEERSKEAAKRKEEIERRRNERLERKDAKALNLKEKGRKDKGKKIKEPVTSQAVTSDLCHMCHQVEPPNTNGTAIDGIDWIECDLCEDWYHQACAGLSIDEDIDTTYFICDTCASTA